MKVETILDLCRECEALLEGHFELSSGRHSDRYFQCALLLQKPERASLLAQELARQLANAGESSIDTVVGPALGAVVWAQEVGRALGVRAIFTERVDGEMVLRRGFRLDVGERVLVVEDVLTTGGSAREVMSVVEEQGATPAAVGAILNRSGGNPFSDLGLPLYALAEVEALTYEAGECPLCESGAAGAAVKPGSRSGARAP